MADPMPTTLEGWKEEVLAELRRAVDFYDARPEYKDRGELSNVVRGGCLRAFRGQTNSTELIDLTSAIVLLVVRSLHEAQQQKAPS